MEPLPVVRTSFTVGEEAAFSKTFTQDDVELFSRLSGDINPVHLDEAYASQTRFGGRIIHGLLVASLISTVLGTAMPGPGSIYLSQQLSFRAPAKVGERLTAKARVIDWDGAKGRIVLATEVVKDDGTQLIVGEAKLVLAAFLK
jgi:3-hydroxybutyryl-CoA dehydratase